MRFSTKCATPSLKSSEPNDAIIALSATAQASASDWKYDWKTCRLMTPIERGDDAVTTGAASNRSGIGDPCKCGRGNVHGH